MEQLQVVQVHLQFSVLPEDGANTSLVGLAKLLCTHPLNPAFERQGKDGLLNALHQVKVFIINSTLYVVRNEYTRITSFRTTYAKEIRLK